MAVNVNAAASDIRSCVINDKSNACPMAVRLAWHASGTFDKANSSGGSDGATMRFEPESTDGANAGLSIMRDMLKPVTAKHANLSIADCWTLAGAKAVEFTGGPAVPHTLCRSDAKDGSSCPPNGRLPDASQGAAHVRDVFYRMGFNDQEIVALSGAHTLGRCHKTRSGFDGPWTSKPLVFDNEYFVNLVDKKWVERKWDGPKQFENADGGELMMLPTDLALIEDDKFRPTVELYAKDEAKFFADFAAAFSKLLHLGTKAPAATEASAKEKASATFREMAMHGSLERCQAVAADADVHSLEQPSNRSALHKAAFWGHIAVVKYLVENAKLDVNVQDSNGDSALHDAARFGHAEVVQFLVKAAAANADLKNKSGQTAADVAKEYGKNEIVALLAKCKL